MTPELERWLTERLERERRAVLEVVVAAGKDILAEQIRRDGEAQKREFGGEFAKLQNFINQMQDLTEKMARLDRDVREIDSATKMN